MPLTPEDVSNKKFTVTRFGQAGYKEDEVDDFLEQVEAELRRLINENTSLQNQAVAPPSPSPAAEPAPGPSAVPTPAPAAAPTPAPAAEAPTPQPPPRPEEGQEAALRTLLLAQRTADEAVAEARREAEGIVSEARERAAALDREAQAQHRTRLSGLEQERTELERTVQSLRAFEQEYRTRLRAYLEGQLRDLEERSLAPSPNGETSPAGTSAFRAAPPPRPNGPGRPAPFVEEATAGTDRPADTPPREADLDERHDTAE